jgi:hypothetical protein
MSRLRPRSRQDRLPLDRPDVPVVVHAQPAAPVRRHRSPAGSVVLVVAALLAVGAAVWILSAVVFTILHVIELIIVGAGCGWVGYKIGHFRGARHPHSRP